MEMSQTNREYETKPNELPQTKFALPRLHTSILLRDSLLSALEKGLEGKLTLLAAPAGLGKTTLVSTWAAQRIAGIHVAWISLDKNADDPVRFWRYVMTASQKFDDEAGRSSLKQLHLSQEINFEAILTAWINELSRVPDRNVLVLDDYHFILSSQIHGQVTFLVDHLPATMHLVILSRSEPPLPLARLRAQGELLELRSTDLQFSLEEASVFLQDALAYPLPPETIAYLHKRAEGWAAGIHIIALMLRFKSDAEARAHFLAEFSGSLQPILEYLVSDVLNTQSEEIQTFLLKTSLLNRLTGSLCDSVVGRTESEEILIQLALKRIPTLPSSNRQPQYSIELTARVTLMHEVNLGERFLSYCSPYRTKINPQFGYNNSRFD